MARTRNPGKRAAEQRFPFRVDVPAPTGGLGGRLNAMLEWCRANIRPGEWDNVVSLDNFRPSA